VQEGNPRPCKEGTGGEVAAKLEIRGRKSSDVSVQRERPRPRQHRKKNDLCASGKEGTRHLSKKEGRKKKSVGSSFSMKDITDFAEGGDGVGRGKPVRDVLVREREQVVEKKWGIELGQGREKKKKFRPPLFIKVDDLRKEGIYKDAGTKVTPVRKPVAGDEGSFSEKKGN